MTRETQQEQQEGARAMWVRADQLRDGDPMVLPGVLRTVNVRAVYGRHDGMIVTVDTDGSERVFAPDDLIDVD